MCRAGSVAPQLQVCVPSLYFFRADCVFLQVLQFPGPLNYRAFFLPLTWWPLEGFLLTRKKWNSFFNFFFHHRVPEFCLNTSCNARVAATVKIYISLSLFHISISRFLLNFPASHLLFPLAVSASENTTFSHLDAKRGALNVDCTYLRHWIGGTSLGACVTAGGESVNSSAPL